MLAGRLQELWWEVIRDSEEAMQEVQYIPKKYRAKPGRKVGAAITSLTRTPNRKRVLAVMEGI
jgi:hypothetical protein